MEHQLESCKIHWSTSWTTIIISDNRKRTGNCYEFFNSCLCTVTQKSWKQFTVSESGSKSFTEKLSPNNLKRKQLLGIPSQPTAILLISDTVLMQNLIIMYTLIKLNVAIILRVGTIHNEMDWTDSVVLCCLDQLISTWSRSDKWQWNVPRFLQLMVVISRVRTIVLSDYRIGR